MLNTDMPKCTWVKSSSQSAEGPLREGLPRLSRDTAMEQLQRVQNPWTTMVERQIIKERLKRGLFLIMK